MGTDPKRSPKVRIAKPGKGPYQLRYTCPDEKREIRISTGIHDEAEALKQKAKLEAKLLLGLDAKPKAKTVRGPTMPWEDFREEYGRLKVATFRSENVGRIISEIGEKAGVVVNGEGKYASAHDLRRSFGQRMADAGVPPRDLQAIMRHSDFRTTEKYYLRDQAVSQAERIAAHLGRDGSMYLVHPRSQTKKGLTPNRRKSFGGKVRMRGFEPPRG